jgi:hypothetical protein
MLRDPMGDNMSGRKGKRPSKELNRYQTLYLIHISQHVHARL